MSDSNSGSDFNSPTKRGSPSTSQNYAADSPIKARLATSFWKKRKMTDTVTNPDGGSETGNVEFVNIIDIKNGKFLGKAIVFRVSLVGLLTTASGGGDSCLKFHGIDSTGEVCIFVYKEASKAAEMVKVNGVFMLQNFDARPENPKFPQHTGLNFQVVMNESSVLTEWSSDGFPEIPFNFVKIADIAGQNFTVNSRIDILGIITKDWGAESTRSGQRKRDILITDKEKDEVLLTLWEDAAETFTGIPGSPLALRKAVVKDLYGERLLNAMRCTLVWVNPEISDGCVKELVEWFEQETVNMNNE